MQPEKGLYQRFINNLGLKRCSTSPAALSALIKAHLSVIPFENISKLYYRSTLKQEHLPSLDQYLSGIEQFHFGGTCYSSNYYFYKLLEYMGYQVQLCSADMKDPDVHMVTKVTLEQKEFLVDVGYAAPFLHPIPLFLKEDQVIVSGRNRYVVKPRDYAGCTRILMYRNEKPKHGYTVKPEARNFADFRQVILNSFQADANFLNSILITKYVAGRFCTLHNLEYSEATGSKTTLHQILQTGEMAKKVEEVFKIPASITSQILDGLEWTGDAWD
jgi:arylamine N-acetyltransferase